MANGLGILRYKKKLPNKGDIRTLQWETIDPHHSPHHFKYCFPTSLIKLMAFSPAVHMSLLRPSASLIGPLALGTPRMPAFLGLEGFISPTSPRKNSLFPYIIGIPWFRSSKIFNNNVDIEKKNIPACGLSIGVWNQRGLFCCIGILKKKQSKAMTHRFLCTSLYEWKEALSSDTDWYSMKRSCSCSSYGSVDSEPNHDKHLIVTRVPGIIRPFCSRFRLKPSEAFMKLREVLFEVGK